MSGQDLDIDAFLTAARTGDVETVWSSLRQGMPVDVSLPESEDLHDASLEEPHLRTYTALHQAVLFGQLEVVQVLIQHGSDVRGNIELSGYDETSTPVYHAVRWGFPELVSLLLDHGASPTANETVVCEPTVLHALARVPPSQFHDGHLDVAKLILDRRVVDIDTRADETTPLEEAAHSGNLRLVQLLLDRDAHVDGSVYPVARAASGGHADVVRFLLDRGANPRGALWSASLQGHLEVVKVLLDRGVGRDERPLQAAAKAGRLAVLECLLEAGCRDEPEPPEMTTALHCANDPDVARMLLAHGSHVDARDSNGETPLFRRDEYYGYTATLVEAIACLLQAGADVNAQNKRGQTALFGHLSEVKRHSYADEAAVKNAEKYYPSNHPSLRTIRRHAKGPPSCPPLEAVRLLLDAGTDVNLRAASGQSALHQILTPRTGPYMPSQGALLAAGLLLDRGAQVSARDQSGLTPLHHAARDGDCPIIQLLLDHGADLGARDEEGGRTPLLRVIPPTCPWLNHEAVAAAQLLLQAGADVRAQTDQGGTVLHEALRVSGTVSQREIDIVGLFLEHGADPRLRDAHGDSAIDLAERKENEELCRLLGEASDRLSL